MNIQINIRILPTSFSGSATPKSRKVSYAGISTFMSQSESCDNITNLAASSFNAHAGGRKDHQEDLQRLLSIWHKLSGPTDRGSNNFLPMLLLFTFVYFCLLLFTFVYFCLLLFTFVYFCLLLFNQIVWTHRSRFK
jgi:hypothetical protein